MGNKHRWYDVIVAWASGEKIQFSYNGSDKWQNYVSDCNKPDFIPAFNHELMEWRVKPSAIIKRYRMALVKWGAVDITVIDVTNSTLGDPVEYNIEGFIRWVGDAVEVEIESDC